MGCEQVCLFFFLFLCQFTCLHAQLCTQEQTSALLQFKRNYSFPASWYCDASFPKMESWKTGSDCCSWDGVDCNNNTGQVIGLDLSCNGLQGTIHPNSSLFLSFPHLQKLNLAYNNFSMCRISPEFSRFTELTHLDLSGGGFSGKVPLEFSFLNKLVSLDLSFNLGLRLEEGGFKLLIQNLSRIRYLDLESVNISSVVPNSLLNRTSLTHLHLSSCALHGKFSGDIFQMPYLKSFKIVFNPALTGYFPQFVNSSSPLRYLNLANTRYPGELPDSIGNLKYLQEFNAYECQLFGSLPTSLGNLTQMAMLGLSYNNFVGVLPSSLSNLKNLNGLFLSDNNLTGPFLSLGLNVEKLTWLDLSNNSLNGTIPSWIFALPALEYLNLGYNMLIDHMDEFQSTLLRIIDVSNNNLHGAIPSSTFELVNLSHLILSSNNFSGTILESNKFRKNLAVLDLQKNNFSGIIHDPFARGNNSLKTLSLNGNGFEGPIPRSLVNCTNLKVLDLGRNKLADRFPIWLENLPCLRMLILGSNKLHGPIPSSKIQLPFPSLRVIDISDNYLNGALPEKYFKSFEAMTNVDEAQFQLQYMEDSNYMTYYYNSVTIVYKGSSIEMERVLTVFIAIDFSRNNFEGEIPNIIGRLNSIRGLNLSHNSLTSHIPTSLGNLTKLEWLDLSSNKLTGEIPRQLTNLISLGTLNLSQNRLTGPIPRGKQFDTFSNDSYINNLALCGPPLTNTCGDPKATQPPPSTYEEEDSEPASGFGWEVILPGYGFGLVVGLVMGYLMFSFRKPLWLVMMVEGVGNRNGKRRKSNPRRRGGRRNLQIANGIV